MIRSLTLFLLAILLTGCAGGPSTGAQDGSSLAVSAPPKRLVTAIRAAVPTVNASLNTIIPGSGAIDRLVSATLTVANEDGVRVPQLAEDVPTTENGLWKLLADGKM